ncbi:MAG: NTP transferase domain-containing protein [Sphaerochaetaceae bacterium]|nr:NTP transferase domain-containing protein [Sphaerochaetaceae bacterium]
MTLFVKCETIRTMNIVLLCAGTSSRMGEVNKLLLPYGNTTIGDSCAFEALKYLFNTEEGGTLIVVTGFQREKVEVSFKKTNEFYSTMSLSKTFVNLKFVYNSCYEEGQFSSTKEGLKTLDDSPFFIALGDMPLVKASHYSTLEKLYEKALSEGYAAIRPFYSIEGNKEPGHPVLHQGFLRKIIIDSPNTWSVKKVLSSYKVLELDFKDNSWALDLDTPQSYKDFKENY